MKECILDHLLADPNLSLDEVVELIEFHMKKVSREMMEEIKEDLKHAFSG